MIIRDARITDLAIVRAMLVRSLTDDHGYGYRPDWHRDIDDLARHYVHRPRADLLVAEIDGRTVGAVALQPDPPTGAVASRYAGRADVAQLVRLVVAPEARRHGVARQLVDALVARAAAREDLTLLCLHTNGRNPTSVAFWRASGARLVLDERCHKRDDADFIAVHYEFDLGRDSHQLVRARATAAVQVA